MSKKIAVLAGDGIGPEVMPQAVNVLQTVFTYGNHAVSFHYADVGGVAFERTGMHLPEKTQALCEQSDAILFGSVGGPVSDLHLKKWRNCERNTILKLRKIFSFSTNYRPAIVYKALADNCPLKLNLDDNPLDILVVRELNGDIYFGEHKRFTQENKRHAFDQADYNEDQIAEVAHNAFQAARRRGKKLTSVDKANVLATSELWREVVTEIGKGYPDVQLKHMLVDNCAMQLVINPSQFDVMVAANLFGDILSDLASALPGSLGMMPSASLNRDGFGLYEPSGGSAQDIAGENIANPIAQILSAAMMLRYSFSLEKEAQMIEQAVISTLELGYVTKDIYSQGKKLLGTAEITDIIINQIKANCSH